MGKLLFGLLLYPLLLLYWVWAIFTIWTWHLAPIFDPLGFFTPSMLLAIILVKVILFSKIKNADSKADPESSLMFFIIPVYSVLIAYLAL